MIGGVEKIIRRCVYVWKEWWHRRFLTCFPWIHCRKLCLLLHSSCSCLLTRLVAAWWWHNALWRAVIIFLFYNLRDIFRWWWLWTLLFVLAVLLYWRCADWFYFFWWLDLLRLSWFPWVLRESVLVCFPVRVSFFLVWGWDRVFKLSFWCTTRCRRRLNFFVSFVSRLAGVTNRFWDHDTSFRLISISG